MFVAKLVKFRVNEIFCSSFSQGWGPSTWSFLCTSLKINTYHKLNKITNEVISYHTRQGLETAADPARPSLKL